MQCHLHHFCWDSARNNKKHVSCSSWRGMHNWFDITYLSYNSHILYDWWQNFLVEMLVDGTATPLWVSNKCNQLQHLQVRRFLCLSLFFFFLLLFHNCIDCSKLHIENSQLLLFSCDQIFRSLDICLCNKKVFNCSKHWSATLQAAAWSHTISFTYFVNVHSLFAVGIWSSNNNIINSNCRYIQLQLWKMIQEVKQPRIIITTQRANNNNTKHHTFAFDSKIWILFLANDDRQWYLFMCLKPWISILATDSHPFHCKKTCHE